MPSIHAPDNAVALEVVISKERIRIEQHGGLGVLWCIGWLFTIGYLQHGFWRGLLAVIIWPYDLGTHLQALMGG